MVGQRIADAQKKRTYREKALQTDDVEIEGQVGLRRQAPDQFGIIDSMASAFDG